MQPVINNQQPARINQHSEIKLRDLDEPINIRANYSHLSLEVQSAGAVANHIKSDDVYQLEIANMLERRVQALAQYKSYPIMQQLISKTINAFDARDYNTLQTFFELGCKLTKDQLETLVQENISKSDSYVLEEGGEEFTSIALAFKYCISWGAKVTQEQLDNCLEKAMSVADGSAINLLLSLGATKPPREKLNLLLQDYLIQDHHSIDIVELNSVLWKNIIGELSIDTNTFLNQKQQEAINNGDYITIRKINGFLQNNLTQDELNQAFQATFNNGYTDSKQFEYLCKLLDMGAIANDSQIDLITKEIINQNTLHDKLPEYISFPGINASPTIDALYKFVNVDSSSTTISSDQIKNSIYLVQEIIESVNNGEKLTNDQLEKCIEKSLDLGWALATNFFLNENNCNKKLTTEQLNYGLQQNLKLFQTADDVRKWLDMGAGIQVFKQCLEESLRDNDLLKLLNLFNISKKIEQLNHILTNQTYIDTAVKKGISQLESINLLELKNNDRGILFTETSDASDDGYNLLTPLLSYTRVNFSTIPGYFINTLLEITLPCMKIEQIGQINELLPLLIETAIDKLECETIAFLVEEMNYALSEEQRDKIKLNLLSHGIPSYMRTNPVVHQLKKLNIIFSQEELNIGYKQALQDSHYTFDLWQSLGAKMRFEITDQ
jgi:hypothetical protein